MTSALFGKYTTNMIGEGGSWIQGKIAKGVATAIAGGVGSVIAGGKFDNGAATAAMGYLFNQMMTKEEADAKANARNQSVMQGRGCAAEGANACAGIQGRTYQENRTQDQIDYGQCKLACNILASPFTVTVNAIAGGGAVGGLAGLGIKAGFCSKLVCTAP
jgi:hypothetical protein